MDCFAFEVSVGALFGLVLDDGSRVALKVHGARRTTHELEAVQDVQRELRQQGFPCPRPLGVRGRATLEEWRDEGEHRDAHEPEVRRAIAAQLAVLLRTARELRPRAELEPFLPGPGGPLWPTPHNVLFDFEATAAGADRIDEIARAARVVRDAHTASPVLGHHDWTTKHIRFDGLRPNVVYDWDSLSTDRETVHVGGSAATFTYIEELPVTLWPSVDEARAFVEDYETSRDVALTPVERRAVRAATVYSRAYTTRCVHALGGDARSLELERFAAELLES